MDNKCARCVPGRFENIPVRRWDVILGRGGEAALVGLFKRRTMA